MGARGGGGVKRCLRAEGLLAGVGGVVVLEAEAEVEDDAGVGGVDDAVEDDAGVGGVDDAVAPLPEAEQAPQVSWQKLPLVIHVSWHLP